MAKARSLQHVKDLPSDVGLIRVFAYANREGTTAPFVDERVTGKDWIYFGRDNNWPGRMRTLQDNCSWLNTAIETNALYIAGSRIVILRKDGSEHVEALKLYKKWTSTLGDEQWRYRTALDIAKLNARCWHVNYDSNSGIALLDHVATGSVRMAKHDKTRDWKIVGAFYSPDWTKINKVGEDHERFKPKAFPLFDFDQKAAAKKTGQFHYLSSYKDEKVYGEPWWIGAIRDAETWTKLADFTRNQIETGFSATVIIDVPANLTPELQVKLQKDIEKTYSGCRGNAIMVITHPPGVDGAKITPVPRTGTADEVNKLRDAAKIEGVQACLIPPILCGIDVRTGMDGKSLAIEQETERFLNQLVRPKQRYFIADPLRKLFELHGITDIDKLYVDDLKAFGGVVDSEMQRMAYLRSVTVERHLAKIGEPALEKGDQRAKKMLIEIGPTAQPATTPAP